MEDTYLSHELNATCEKLFVKIYSFMCLIKEHFKKDHVKKMYAQYPLMKLMMIEWSWFH